jgi:hypothetical protein
VLVSACPGLPWLLCVIKSCFKGQWLNIMCILCIGSNSVGWKQQQNYQKSEVFFGNRGAQGFCFPLLPIILDLPRWNLYNLLHIGCYHL